DDTGGLPRSSWTALGAALAAQRRWPRPADRRGPPEVRAMIAATARVDAPRAEADAVWTALRGAALFRSAGDDVLRRLCAAGLVHHREVPRDSLLDIPADLHGALCLVISGQVSIGVF